MLVSSAASLNNILSYLSRRIVFGIRFTIKDHRYSIFEVKLNKKTKFVVSFAVLGELCEEKISRNARNGIATNAKGKNVETCSNMEIYE